LQARKAESALRNIADQVCEIQQAAIGRMTYFRTSTRVRARARHGVIQPDRPGDPIDFVVSKYLHRRDEGQRAAVAAKIANMRQGSDHGNQHTGGKRPIGRLPDEPPVSNVQAAKMKNVSERSAGIPVKRCGARTRLGRPCIRKALSNGRCPNHGGLSTGPKTEAGRRRIAQAQKRRWTDWRRARQLMLPANSAT
jgi:hypothetical protein